MIRIRVNRKVSVGIVFALTIILILLLATPLVPAKSSYAGQCAECPIGDCAVCHDGMPGLNSYGVDLQTVDGFDLDLPGAIDQLANEDSDGDGYTNAEELDAGSNPGDATDLPPEGTGGLMAGTTTPVDGSVFVVGQTVTFDGSASRDADGGTTGIVSYTWSFPDNSTATGITTTKVFNTAGERTIRLTVTDAEGSDAELFKITIFDGVTNVAPIPSFFCRDCRERVSTGIKVNAPMTLVASESFDPNDDTNANGIIDGTETDGLTYTWDFGDGTTGTGRTAVHVYTIAGPYTVTLTATDAGAGADTNALAATYSKEITVHRPHIYIQEFTQSTLHLREGEELVIYATLANTGEVPGPVTAELLENGEAVTPPLEDIIVRPGTTEKVTFKWTVERGHHEYLFTILTEGAIISKEGQFTAVSADTRDFYTLPGPSGAMTALSLLGIVLILRRREVEA